jgi:hypothetical protein
MRNLGALVVALLLLGFGAVNVWLPNWYLTFGRWLSRHDPGLRTVRSRLALDDESHFSPSEDQLERRIRVAVRVARAFMMIGGLS